MFQVVLHEPEIPPNTGNIIRLCANTGADLHLIHPLGFAMDDARLVRAGLDYREYARVAEHAGYEEYLAAAAPPRVFAFSVSGGVRHTEADFRPGDALLLGKESAGLPEEILSHPSVTAAVRIPMLPNRRSLNLSNAAAVAVYEAWRRQGFPNAL